METPILEQQLLNLSPRGRVIAGAVMIPFGALAAVAFWHQGMIWFGSLFCVLFGFGLLGSGLRDRARQRRFDAEVERAEREWEVLRQDLARGKQDGKNPARMLQERGYREFAVRRWIVRELGGG